MLKQGAIGDVRKGLVSRSDGLLVAAMCFYPRGLKRELIDLYRADLAPDRELFREWKNIERDHGHDQAFIRTRYEERFSLSEKGLWHLRELAELSAHKDVILF